MKYKLLFILVFLSTITNAQKVWDKEAYSAMCKKQLNAVLVHIYDLVMDGKFDAYKNDSFATKMTNEEFKERFSFENVETFKDYRYPDDPYAFKDSTQMVYLNPNIDLKGFGIILNYSLNSAETSTFSTTGINLLYELISSGVKLGLIPLCTIKWQDILDSLTINELVLIQSYIKTAKLVGNFDYLNDFSDTMDYLAEDITWRIPNQYKYQIQLTEKWQNAIAIGWFNQYIHAAKMASINGKKGYKDAQLKKRFDNLEKGLIGSAVIQISDYHLPDDPYAFKDTLVYVSYNWETEQIAWFKSPKGEFVIGFKAYKLWFYMKLEDLLPYLPKEVLPSLELLKKEI